MSSDKPAWIRSRQLCDELGEPDEFVLEIVAGVARAAAYWHDGATDICVKHHDRDGDTYDLGEDGPGRRPRPLPAEAPPDLRGRIALALQRPPRPERP